MIEEFTYKYGIYRNGREDLAYSITGIAMEKGFGKCQAYLQEFYGERYLGLRPFTPCKECAGA